MRFIQLPILTKLLGTSHYGTWSLIFVTVSVLTQLAILGLGMAVVRFLAAEVRGAIIAILASGALPTAVALFFVLRQIGFQFPKFT